MLVSTSNSSAGRSAEPVFLPFASTTSMVVAAMSRTLHCGADKDDATLVAGDGALDEQQALLGVDGLNQQVLDGATLVAHAAGHAQALEDARGVGGAADGAGLAVVAVGTV